MTYKGHDGYKHYIIGVATGSVELEGCFYTRFVKSNYIFPEVQIMVEQLENGENNAQSVPYVLCEKRRNLGKEITRENNKEKKRRKVEHVPE